MLRLAEGVMVCVLLGALRPTHVTCVSEEVCNGNQTNYTRYEHSTRTITQLGYVQTIRTIEDDCNIIQVIWSLFPWSSKKCKTRYMTVMRTTIEYEETVDTNEIVACCPGYINSSDEGICIKNCEKGKYGEFCNQTCSCGDVNLYCDSSGGCLCPDGYMGENCTNECDDGFYGFNCSRRCICENNSTCSITDGSCNCTVPGWTGYLCHLACNGSYGLNCNETCRCNENQTCDHVDGVCTCKPGWRGENCSDECYDTNYGVNCTEECTCYTNNTKYCDKATGFCHCQSGFIGINCSEECPLGLFGEGCSYNCSDVCTGIPYCFPNNGSCMCLGKKGDNCSEECDMGTYWLNCSFGCNCTTSNMNGSCNATSGQCFCDPGWSGRDCQTECDDGKYGEGCGGMCTCNETQTCDHVNGTCTCKAGWGGINCSQECSNGTFGEGCESSCECNEQQMCNPVNGNCTCKPGWQGDDCLQAVITESEPLKESFSWTYALIGSGLFIAAVIAVALCAYCLFIRNKRRNQKEPLDSGGIDNVMYDEEKHDGEKRKSLYEDDEHDYDDPSFMDGERQESTPNLARKDEEEKTEKVLSKDGLKKEDPDHSMENEKRKTTGLNDEQPLLENSLTFCDSTKDKCDKKKTDSKDYDTYDEARKREKDRKSKVLKEEVEEEYDNLAHRSSVLRQPGHENYSNFSIKKQKSLQENEEELYNVLNEGTNKRRTLALVDSNYHHVDLTTRSVDGERFSLSVYGNITKPDHSAAQKSNYSHISIKEHSVDGDKRTNRAEISKQRSATLPNKARAADGSKAMRDKKSMTMDVSFKAKPDKKSSKTKSPIKVSDENLYDDVSYEKESQVHSVPIEVSNSPASVKSEERSPYIAKRKKSLPGRTHDVKVAYVVPMRKSLNLEKVVGTEQVLHIKNENGNQVKELEENLYDDVRYEKNASQSSLEQTSLTQAQTVVKSSEPSPVMPKRKKSIPGGKYDKSDTQIMPNKSMNLKASKVVDTENDTRGADFEIEANVKYERNESKTGLKQTDVTHTQALANTTESSPIMPKRKKSVSGSKRDKSGSKAMPNIPFSSNATKENNTEATFNGEVQNKKNQSQTGLKQKSVKHAHTPTNSAESSPIIQKGMKSITGNKRNKSDSKIVPTNSLSSKAAAITDKVESTMQQTRNAGNEDEEDLYDDVHYEKDNSRTVLDQAIVTQMKVEEKSTDQSAYKSKKKKSNSKETHDKSDQVQNTGHVKNSGKSKSSEMLNIEPTPSTPSDGQSKPKEMSSKDASESLEKFTEAIDSSEAEPLINKQNVFVDSEPLYYNDTEPDNGTATSNEVNKACYEELPDEEPKQPVYELDDLCDNSSLSKSDHNSQHVGKNSADLELHKKTVKDDTTRQPSAKRSAERRKVDYEDFKL